MKLDADRLNALEAAAIAAARPGAAQAVDALAGAGAAHQTEHAALVIGHLANLTPDGWTELRRLADEINAEQETK